MKTKDIEMLKVMSAKVIDQFPADLTVDGHGDFYTDGERITAFELITKLTKATTRASEFNKVIQEIEVKKIATKPRP